MKSRWSDAVTAGGVPAKAATTWIISATCEGTCLPPELSPWPRASHTCTSEPRSMKRSGTAVGAPGLWRSSTPSDAHSVHSGSAQRTGDSRVGAASGMLTGGMRRPPAGLSSRRHLEHICACACACACGADFRPRLLRAVTAGRAARGART